MTEQELKDKYPAYFKSIFSDFLPNNPEVIEWKENVLEKVKGNSILPHYIKRDKDFDTFWGWITHFFAIIVYFGRNFKKFFTNYTDYLNEIGEFMREKDYIQDSRVQINKNLEVPISEEIYYNIFCNVKLTNGIPFRNLAYDTSDFLPITEGGILIFKVLGYNSSLNEYSGHAIRGVLIAFYYANKQVGEASPIGFNISANKAKYGYRYLCPKSSDSSNPYCFARISYPRLGDSSLPLYLGVFSEGSGESFVTNKDEQDIFGIYSDFRKRGTLKGGSLIKKIFETQKEDNFYADYLPQVNTGWFLNRNCPTFGRLYKNIKINALLAQSISVSSGVRTIVTMEEQYLTLNQNTSLIVKWRGEIANSVTLNISVYDKDKNLLSENPILSNWVFDSVNHTLTANSVDSVTFYPKYNEVEGIYEAELPIELINNPKSGVFSTDTYDKNSFLNAPNKICLFSRYDNYGEREAYYIKITHVILNGEETPHIEDNLFNINFEVGLYLRKLPITMGFLNNKQYYICCFKNNGSYSNEEAIELVSQKAIPYNGYRIFIDNIFYKNNVTIPLNLKNVYFNKIDKKIYLNIFGGVPPYSYRYDTEIADISYLQKYEKTVAVYGTHLITIIDNLGQTLLVKISCQPFNQIDYKFKIFVSKSNSIQVFLKLSGGTETSYSVSKYTYYYPYLWDNANKQLLDKNNVELLSREVTESGRNEKVIMPANVWIDITKIVGNNFNQISEDTSLYIRDNGIPAEAKNWLVNEYNDLELNLQELFCDFALDFYDNGVGEFVN